MNKISDILNENIFEYEVAAEIDYLLQKNGANSSAFTTISSFGKNTSNPHYTHGNYKLKDGDFILCDFGARYKRYNSDMTRTFVLGKPNQKQKKIYETVLKSQEKGFENIKPGIAAKDVHNVVNDFINKTEFKDLFIHSTGHSLGMDVHDPGVGFNSKCDITLKENMVLTVEPGIYLPNLGGVRIEDDILIKEDGIEILTTASRYFIEI
jgi:Xaa-Pro dipeptidase